MTPTASARSRPLDTAIALERLGDREALRDHVLSFGCKLVWPKDGGDVPLQQWAAVVLNGPPEENE